MSSSPNIQQKFIQWALVLTLWGVFFYLLASQGIVSDDEGWYLQVTNRVNHGETLYKDMFYGVTPLSIYLMVVLTHIFGLELLVVKGIVAICITSCILIGIRILHELDVSRSISFLFTGAIFLFVASPFPTGFYNWLSLTFLMGAWLAVMRWRNELQTSPGSYKNLIAAGGCAGLCFLSKQNVGLFAIVALFITIAITMIRFQVRTAAPFLVVLISFLLVSAMMLAPIYVSGATSKFIEYCFTGKKTYLNVHLAYLRGNSSIRLEGVSSLKSSLIDFNRYPSLPRLRIVIVLCSFFLVPVLITGAILKLLKKSERETTLIVIVFAAAALLTMFPRPSVQHLAPTVPILIVASLYCWKTSFPPKDKASFSIRATAGAMLTILILIYLAIPIIQIYKGMELSGIPHFRGVWIRPSTSADNIEDAQKLSSIAMNHKMFILGPAASFYYLVSDLKNPTPFDIPVSTTFGFHGEEDIEKAILERRITAVCLPHELEQIDLMPLRLVGWIRSTMKPLTMLNYCTVYERL